MPDRSSKKRHEEEGPNVTAFRIVQEATEATEGARAGPEILADLIRDIQGALKAGDDPDALAERLWPTFRDAIVRATGESAEEIAAGLREWQEVRHESPAAELGRRGGKKGGKARAEALSPERRREIAQKAARARWEKNRTSD